MYKRVWVINHNNYSIKTKIFIECTEENLWKWMESELGGMYGYYGASEKDIEAAKVLGLPIYMYK